MNVEIRDYTTGRAIADADVADDILTAYEGQKIGQWPEGICRADELLSGEELARLGIDGDRAVWIELW